MSAHPSSTSSNEVRRALVTGASSGIGAAIARAFAELGWAVAVGARRTDRLGAVARQIDSAGGRAFVHVLDVRDPKSIDVFFGAAENALGTLDVVVNNAGIGVPGALHEVRVEDIEAEVSTNLVGAMLVARRAIPAMLERRSGDLVFITSLNAVLPRPLQAGYTASKMGLEGVARVLQMELEGKGVRSIIVRPGPTMTEFGDEWAPGALTEVFRNWQHWGLMRHAATLSPERVAAAVVTAVTAPRGTHLDVIQINPEATVDGES